MPASTTGAGGAPAPSKPISRSSAATSTICSIADGTQMPAAVLRIGIPRASARSDRSNTARNRLTDMPR